MKTIDQVKEYIETKIDFYIDANADIKERLGSDEKAWVLFEGAKMALVDLISWIDSNDD